MCGVWEQTFSLLGIRPSVNIPRAPLDGAGPRARCKERLEPQGPPYTHIPTLPTPNRQPPYLPQIDRRHATLALARSPSRWLRAPIKSCFSTARLRGFSRARRCGAWSWSARPPRQRGWGLGSGQTALSKTRSRSSACRLCCNEKVNASDVPHLFEIVVEAARYPGRCLGNLKGSLIGVTFVDNVTKSVLLA